MIWPKTIEYVEIHEIYIDVDTGEEITRTTAVTQYKTQNKTIKKTVYEKSGRTEYTNECIRNTRKHTTNLQGTG